MMTAVFERGVLALVAGLVAVLLVVTLMRPPAQVTYSPTAPTSEYAEVDDQATEDLDLAPAAGRPAAIAATPVRARSNARLAPREDAPPVTLASLNRTFRSLDYSLESVIAGEREVPRVLLTRLPRDLKGMKDAEERKRVFLETMLPLVLKANEEILIERRRVWRLYFRQRAGERLGAVERLWLAMMAERYKAPRGDTEALLDRVDMIPPSMALAQAAKETGWGTSRFAQQGNALFGQWTWSSNDPAMVPLARDGDKTHRVRAFPTLLDSVRAYARNLNSHRAYREFRATRATYRARGVGLDGRTLSGGLLRYSELGGKYVERIRAMIDVNGLTGLDDARLRRGGPDREPII